MNASPPINLTLVETSSSNDLTLALRQAFDKALEDQSKLEPAIFDVPGFSGRKFRMFLNNLFATMQNPRYLEIGVFKGGSFIPAIYTNKMHATAVDDWSWPGSDISVFKALLYDYGRDAETTILNKDFRQINFAEIGRFNVMFYDGSHAEEDQLRGVKLPAIAMDSSYIVIVDDWNWPEVRRGSLAGLREAGCQIDYSIDLRTTIGDTNNLPEIHGPGSDWHNGMFAAVISRKPQ